MRTCLIVDDSGIVRKVARRIIEPMNFAVIEATNGREALEACEKAMPEAVLLDWNMPVMDGLEFLKALRAMDGGDAPKVIFCTTENELPKIQTAIMAGANEYVMKPFDEEIIQSKFQTVGLI